MDPVRALNFDSVSSSTSVSSTNTTVNDGIPTTVTTPVAATANPVPNESCHITTSLDNGRKHTNNPCPFSKETKTKNKNNYCSSNNSGTLDNNNGDESILDDYFGSSLTVEQKFEALQNYVKSLSTDEWMYAHLETAQI